MSDFARHLRVDQIGDGRRLDFVADDAERGAIAKRLDLVSLDRLEAHAVLSPRGEGVRAEGRLAAVLVQRCVVTNDPVTAHIDEPFIIDFLPEPAASGPSDEEVELAADELDVVFFDGAEIDLGAAIADTLALSIDRFPRTAGADAALKEAGVMTEAEASPFAILAKLRGGGES
ncbi:MAG: DUF177 domain-containing protein [Sphingomicrobium sp.]